MRLLLLLSALLAVLSGAGASARAPQAQSIAVATRVAAAPVVRAHAPMLLSAPRYAARVTPVEPMRTAVVLPAPKLWAERRRE